MFRMEKWLEPQLDMFSKVTTNDLFKLIYINYLINIDKKVPPRTSLLELRTCQGGVKLKKIRCLASLAGIFLCVVLFASSAFVVLSSYEYDFPELSHHQILQQPKTQ